MKQKNRLSLFSVKFHPVSHSKERAEKICLNCRTELNGRYCHICGQENIEPKHTLWGLITHFFNDITHFDGKFFSTVKYLMWKPGFLSAEYVRGRRANYLDPVRMYIFTSAVFFLILYANVDTNFLVESDAEVAKEKAAAIIAQRNTKITDTIFRSQATDSTGEGGAFPGLRKGFNPKPGLAIDVNSTGDPFEYANRFRNVEEYNAAQGQLAKEDRDNWTKRMLTRRQIQLRLKYGGITTKEFRTALLDKFVHSFPYLLFISLPLYALYLKLLYLRNKKNFYVDHMIFLIHLYVFTFIVLTVYFAFGAINNRLDTSWIDILKFALFIFGIVYTVRAMRRYYEQGWLKTVVKFIVFNILTGISMLFLFLLFLGFTLYRV